MTNNDSADSEIGRELFVADLKPGQIVVVAPPETDAWITIWVESIDAETVVFFAGELNWHVINFIKDGRLVDDLGRIVRVFEYRGKV